MQHKQRCGILSMNLNIIINFGKLTFTQNNFNFFRTPDGPKFKFPTKRLLGLIFGLLSWFSTGVEAPIVSQLKVEMISPANGSTFTVGSTVQFVARATTTQGTIKSVEFHANNLRLGKTETHTQ
jgi:Bacterial Ig domain